MANLNRRHLAATFAATMLGIHIFPGPVEAAEGGGSHYLPGTMGDIFLALPPRPGLHVSDTVFFQSGDLGVAVLGGQVDLNLDLNLVLNMVGAAYTFETPLLGGTYTIAAMVPFGSAKVKAELVLPGGGTIDDSDKSFAFSDIAFVPLQLNWSVGAFSFKFSEVIVAPTGGYDVGEAANLGRNYWSFDTVGAVTWFNAATGTEISIAPGIMVNTENKDINYKTGTELHVDYVVNKFISETFVIGLRGYYYQQLSGDSGSGAVLGDFKSRSLAIGVGFFWMPESANGKLTIQGKWMHDVDHKNRFNSDYGTIGIAWKF